MNAVVNPDYWREKMADAVARGEIHRAIYTGSIDEFSAEQQRQIAALRGKIGDNDSILDVGCGYGRLLEFLPKTWKGDYLGIDISPDLIGVARRIHPEREFVCMSVIDWLYSCSGLTKKYDVAVCLWIKSMMLENKYRQIWGEIELLLPRVALSTLIVD